MLRVTTILLLSVPVLGFAPNYHPSLVRRSQVLQMAEEEEDSMVASKFERIEVNEANEVKNLMRNVETEQKWKDTEMGANTSVDINWSSIFVIIPGEFCHSIGNSYRYNNSLIAWFWIYLMGYSSVISHTGILILNDFLHFLPKEWVII